MSDTPATATWRAALAFVLAREGVDLAHGDTGYVNDPRDPGGATNYGITQNSYDLYREARGLSAQPVRTITPAEVEAIYRRTYWRESGAEALADVRPHLALCVFDWAVNGGVERARRYLQAVCGVTVDGVVGPRTRAAARARAETPTVARYLEARAAHYHVRAGSPSAGVGHALLTQLGLRPPYTDPKAVAFLPGWLARCRWVAREAGCVPSPLYAKD